MEYVRFTAKTLHPSAIDSYSTPQNKGNYAEDVVTNLLLRQSWTIEGRNIRSRGSEIDIVCSKGKTLSFVEVKYKKNPPSFWTAENLGLTSRKKQALWRGALRFTSRKALSQRHIHWRFDLVVVTGAFDTIHYFVDCMN